MGFYGNVYHYTAEAFATVVLKNSGLDNYTTQLVGENYDQVSSSQGSNINARNRETGLGIYSGNHWIQLVKANDADAFYILHGDPVADRAEEEKTFLNPLDPRDKTEVSYTETEITKHLNFGDYLIVPQIEYDAAGHIVFSNANSYCYQLPLNPNEQLNADVEALGKRMDEIDTDWEEKTAEIKAVEENVVAISAGLEEKLIDQELVIDAVKTATAAVEKITTYENETKYTITTHASSIYQLEQKVKELEDRIKSLELDPDPEGNGTENPDEPGTIEPDINNPEDNNE